jgi:hypothetical protein
MSFHGMHFTSKVLVALNKKKRGGTHWRGRDSLRPGALRISEKTNCTLPICVICNARPSIDYSAHGKGTEDRCKQAARANAPPTTSQSPMRVSFIRLSMGANDPFQINHLDTCSFTYQYHASIALR